MTLFFDKKENDKNMILCKKAVYQKPKRSGYYFYSLTPINPALLELTIN